MVHCCCASIGCPNFSSFLFMSQHLEGITRGCGDMSVMNKSSAKERLHRNTSDLNTITLTTASGTGHIFCAATSLQRGQAWL